MTDKASVEIPSPVAGKVLALGGEVGQMLAVGSELIRIEVEDAAGERRRPTPTPARDRRRAGASPRAGRTRRRRADARARRPPAAPAAPRAATATPRDVATPRPIASPAVRARAWELGVDLRDVTATGPPAASSRPTSTPTSPAAAPARSPVSAPRAAGTSDATHDMKIVGLRRKIAQKMQESKRRIPHYTYVEEVDVTEIEALRARLNEKWGASAAASRCSRSWSARSFSRCANSRWSTPASTTRPAC
jgi:2-oxoisovalerate dehydrogenase E2 component (dihydrolipoyl transacylase)